MGRYLTSEKTNRFFDEKMFNQKYLDGQGIWLDIIFFNFSNLDDVRRGIKS